MRALSSQLLAPAAPQATHQAAPPAAPQAAASTEVRASEVQAAAVRATTVEPQGSAPIQTPASIRLPATAGAPPKPAPKSVRRDPDSPRAFDRPIKALAEKAQNVLPQARLRFDAEINYALTILRRIRGGRQSFSIEEVRELINGKFGLRLTARDDLQLSASLANQANLIRTPRGPRGGVSAQCWRFQIG
jgi:hypothetical protein